MSLRDMPSPESYRSLLKPWSSVGEPTVRVTKMSRGSHCCPNFCISFAPTPSLYCAQYVCVVYTSVCVCVCVCVCIYIYIYMTVYRLYMCYRCYQITLQ
jgi:hypothetical protein